MKIFIVTQARTGSTRLPNKVLKVIKGKSLLEIHLERIKKSLLATKIIVATTINSEDDLIEKEAKRLGFPFSRGSENDVLDRFYFAVKDDKPDYIVRVTSDCPLLDPKLIDSVIQSAIDKKVDYCSNVLLNTFPDGQDIEVLTFFALEKAWKNAKLISEREHVTPYIRNNSSFFNKEIFRAFNYQSKELKYKDIRMTVDETSDFEVIKLLIESLGADRGWRDYAESYLKNSQISILNKNILRNEGYQKSLKND
ncbi:glutamate-1-semialdehyde 2,1-aminomutase/spore coat polysaccharide biosynthesis protein SpsF [Lutibacter sp. Hel_I_33_5]|uniref:cytidylyltransferase domain-containing protein n=1 Tax=Lutibacter sp. Hel_I_33_5 TaxID=1566289 RepID=UPI0011A34DAD|nr:glycosyltransferase family protein [Lutibacter sp. Hel_I_33_5]TVZ56196.1 glutamate-1-semialdehyde 2,1-aminomutase/spore coat polysaccharide biosynthesis protein SpsF [Lutibacter sp. Hel_I_33_5]